MPPCAPNRRLSPALHRCVPYRVRGPVRVKSGPSGRGMDTDLVTRAQRGDEEAFASLAVAAGIGSTRSRIEFCATSISPRTRRSRRCSPSGATSRSFATRHASMPGRIGSSCAPATPRGVDLANGHRTSACFPLMSRCRRTARAPSSIATSSSAGSGGSPSTIARWWSCTTTSTCRSTRSPTRSASRPGRSDLDFITRCAGCARRSTPTRGRLRGKVRNEHHRDVTRTVRSWLEEGVTTLPDRVLDTVLDEVDDGAATSSMVGPALRVRHGCSGRRCRCGDFHIRHLADHSQRRGPPPNAPLEPRISSRLDEGPLDAGTYTVEGVFDVDLAFTVPDGWAVGAVGADHVEIWEVPPDDAIRPSDGTGVGFFLIDNLFFDPAPRTIA